MALSLHGGSQKRLKGLHLKGMTEPVPLVDIAAQSLQHRQLAMQVEVPKVVRDDLAKAMAAAGEGGECVSG